MEMNRGLAPVLAVMISLALFQASAAAPLAATRFKSGTSA